MGAQGKMAKRNWSDPIFGGYSSIRSTLGSSYLQATFKCNHARRGEGSIYVVFLKNVAHLWRPEITDISMYIETTNRPHITSTMFYHIPLFAQSLRISTTNPSPQIHTTFIISLWKYFWLNKTPPVHTVHQNKCFDLCWRVINWWNCNEAHQRFPEKLGRPMFLLKSIWNKKMINSASPSW